MAIGRTNSGGSGGGLAVYIVGGTTQPTNPKENTVWVNTDTAITEWVFSATQPSTRLDGSALSGGEVWFQVDTAATAPINVLKKNGAYEYPQVCYQYISGAWVAKTARTYQNGAWVDWILYLYNNGVNNTAVGGGLTASGWSWAGSQEAAPTFTPQYISFTTSLKDVHMNCGTNTTYDLTKYSRIYILYSVYTTLRHRGDFCITSTKSTNDRVAYKDFSVATNQTDYIDISSLMGSYYIGIGMATTTENAVDERGRVYAIWFE